MGKWTMEQDMISINRNVSDLSFDLRVTNHWMPKAFLQDSVERKAPYLYLLLYKPMSYIILDELASFASNKSIAEKKLDKKGSRKSSCYTKTCSPSHWAFISSSKFTLSRGLSRTLIVLSLNSRGRGDKRSIRLQQNLLKKLIRKNLKQWKLIRKNLKQNESFAIKTNQW